MQTFERLSAALVIALAVTGVAHAAPTPDAMDPSGPGLATEPRAQDDTSENPRVMTGRVLKVDPGQGTLVLQTPIGIIALRGPSEELRQVSVGDVVQVEMVASDEESVPSASPRLDRDVDVDD
ncbi:MAG TPA: hypothetical protein VHZ49_02060 [Methylomirabilota bacterium]|jgi:hypothetical protein|nr:hypothetical protein [Methylomirabilota bacterium]